MTQSVGAHNPPRDTRAAASILDVSRPVEHWRWTGVITQVVTAAVLVWSGAIVLALVLASIGMAIAVSLWAAQSILDWF